MLKFRAVSKKMAKATSNQPVGPVTVLPNFPYKKFARDTGHSDRNLIRTGVNCVNPLALRLKLDVSTNANCARNRSCAISFDVFSESP